jgi:DNA-binding NtrC family response regulator
VEFRALIVDDEETYARSLKRLLGRRGVHADHAATAADALVRVRKRAYDLVVLDYLLPDGSGLDLIPPVAALRPAPRVLMMTAFGTIENAVEAMRRGAWDYLTKSTAIDDIVERVLDAQRVAQARLALGPDGGAPLDEPRAQLPGLLGDSPAMAAARARISDVARAPETTVLLTGESGTGKGVAARAIHALGPRAAEPFVALDCVALPPTLAESELFGHEKGAFTGADKTKPGKLEACGRGTVLLDEIGDMEAALQGKLLRVLEERTFERVGGLKSIPMNARVIAASHRDLGRLVEEKRFRLDLYHRLMVFPIHLPPLRERGDDVLSLAEHFVAEFAGRLGKRFGRLGAEVRDALSAYDFPGNVRELKNVVERAVILAPGRELTLDLLPERVFATRRSASPLSAEPATTAREGALNIAFRPGTDTLDALERKLLEEALRMAGGKKSRAAALLGISRFSLMRRVEKHRL